jgi:hypothetical protein
LEHRKVFVSIFLFPRSRTPFQKDFYGVPSTQMLTTRLARSQAFTMNPSSIGALHFGQLGKTRPSKAV